MSLGPCYRTLSKVLKLSVHSSYEVEIITATTFIVRVQWGDALRVFMWGVSTMQGEDAAKDTGGDYLWILEGCEESVKSWQHGGVGRAPRSPEHPSGL